METQQQGKADFLLLQEKLNSFLAQLHSEYGVLDRLGHKYKNQHRRSSYFQFLSKVRSDLRLLHSTRLEEILSSCFLIISGKKPAQKVHLLESLSKKRHEGGKHNILDRFLGADRILSEVTEPMLKAAIEISTLLARSFFMGFSLTTLAVLARLRVLVQQTSSSKKVMTNCMKWMGNATVVSFENEVADQKLRTHFFFSFSSKKSCLESEPISDKCEDFYLRRKNVIKVISLNGSTIDRSPSTKVCALNDCSETSKGLIPLKRKADSGSKVAFVSVKRPAPPEANVDASHLMGVKEIGSGSQEDPFYNLLTGGDLRKSLF